MRFDNILATYDRTGSAHHRRLALEQIDAPLVLDFLSDLETTRRKAASTGNVTSRDQSFMHFVEYRVPSAMFSFD